MADLAVSGARDAPGVLPRPSTSFVGRESELAQARNLLGRTRLLTLTGPGGCGKTRLAIELAGRVTDDFPHGVHFVSLAAVRDPALVPVSMARGIGLQDARDTPLLEHLSGYLAERDAVAILDNMEQVLAAGGFVADLLAATTRPRILVTSRSPLHLSWEQEFPVPALRVPPGGALSVAAVAACESVRLFAARAAASVPGFTVTDENAAAIAGIAERLDGLPLAIELAAARVKLLAPAAILARLEDSLGLLVSGRRDVPDRQRTLRATIAWSYDLLSEAAEALLAACSVFRGGIDLAVLEAVCAEAVDLRVPVLDALAELVDHSLLRRAVPQRVPRVRDAGDRPRVRGRAAGAVPDAARCARRMRRRSGRWPRTWPVRRAGRPGRARPARTRARQLPCCAGLVRRGAGHGASSREPAHRVLVHPRTLLRGQAAPGRTARTGPGRRPRAGGRAHGAAWLATDQGDRAAAVPLLDETLARARAAGDLVGEATVLYYRGRATPMLGDPAGGADIERALELQIEAGDDTGVAAALWLGGAMAIFGEDHRPRPRTARTLRGAVRGARPAGDRGPGPPAARHGRA